MKTALWLLLLCSMAHAASCPTGQQKDEATLIKIEQTWELAIEQHDRAALECILATEFEEADFAGKLIDRAHMLAGLAGDDGTRVELSELGARVYGDFGYARGVGTVTQGSQAVEKTRFTDIFVYRDGRWQCVAGHESKFMEKQTGGTQASPNPPRKHGDTEARRKLLFVQVRLAEARIARRRSS